MNNKSYKKEQLNKMDVKSETVSIKVFDYNGNSTNQLNLDDTDSIDILINFLKRRKRIIEKDIFVLPKNNQIN